MAVIISAAVIITFYLFLVFPSGRKRKTKEFFSLSMFAHRGLFNNTDTPENSMKAFEKACEYGYGIELDLHITKDGKIVVFHDDSLKRMCGIDKKTEEITFDELQKLTLLSSNEKIPLFSDVLELINGRAVLIVEIKGTSRSTDACKVIAEMLKSYKGRYCIESFNPMHVRYFKKHCPDVIRGQLSGDLGGFKPFLLKILLQNLLLNFISRPDFVAYDIKKAHNLSFAVSKLAGGYPVAWTVRTEDDYKANKKLYSAFICEGFIYR